MSSTTGPWQYEEDAFAHDVHYVLRRNSSEPSGIERKVFSTKNNPMRFLKEKNPGAAKQIERESLEQPYSVGFCLRCGSAIRVCTARVCSKQT